MTENVQTVAAATHAAAPMDAQVPTERMLTQKEVNDLVGAVKHDAYQKGLQDKEREFSAQQPAVRSPLRNESQMGGMPGMTPEQQAQTIREEVQRAHEAHAQQMAANNVFNDMRNRIFAAQDKYPDIVEKMKDLNPDAFPSVIHLAHGVPNSADVMYHLAQNPSKAAILQSTAQLHPAGAMMEMRKLSESIKANQEALANAISAKEPLSQVKPSVTGTDSGEMTIADYKKKYR